MAKKRGLASNRGLDALLGSIKKEREITDSALKPESYDEQTPLIAPTLQEIKQEIQKQQTVSDDDISLVNISLEKLQSGKYQPRRNIDEASLVELANSIRQHGVMQPIVIRPLLLSEVGNESPITHEIIAGERRWRAAKMAGIKTIPAIERSLSDELAIALALIENIQREDLSIIEQATALQRFHTEFGMSHAMIADVVGKARATVSNLLRLNQLHDNVKHYLNDKTLDMGHARALLSLSVEQQPVIAEKIITQQLTVRDAEKLIRSILKPTPKQTPAQISNEREIEMINQKLSDTFGATVKLKQKKNGKGSVEIFFYSEEELEELLQQLQSKSI